MFLFIFSSLFLFLESVAQMDTHPLEASWIPEVPQGYYFVSTETHEPHVQTFGASTCLILVLWDSESRIGALAHVAAGQPFPESLSAILMDIRSKRTAGHLYARIFGGWKYWSDSILRNLTEALEQNGIPWVQVEPFFDPQMTPDQRFFDRKDPNSRHSIDSSITVDFTRGWAFPYQEEERHPCRPPALPLFSPLKRHPLSLFGSGHCPQASREGV